MTRVWFAEELETVAIYWRLDRRDGVTLGFVTHDRDLWFDGVPHRAAPGLVPSAIRRSAGLEPDSAEVEAVLSHDALCARDIAAGRFDGAGITIGLVDWHSCETCLLYRGTIGEIAEEAGRFQATTSSAKAALRRDTVPRTSPVCRARFCGPGCTLAAPAYTRRALLGETDPAGNAVVLADGIEAAPYAGGELRWLDGPRAGLTATIAAADGDRLVLAEPLLHDVGAGRTVLLREGCDRTLATCATRFGNAINFQGEPWLPGTDFTTRPAPPR